MRGLGSFRLRLSTRLNPCLAGMDGFDANGLLLTEPQPVSSSASAPASAEELMMKEQLRKIVMPSARRPDFALSAATGRPNEFVFGAELPRPDDASQFAIKVGAPPFVELKAAMAPSVPFKNQFSSFPGNF